MSTSILSYLFMVLCVGTLVGIAGSDSLNKGVHYKRKHLQTARGTLVFPTQHHDDRRIASPSSGEVGQLMIQAKEVNYPVQRPYRLAIQPVSFDVYREAMAEAKTHYDVFRIFVSLDLTDAEIDAMLRSLNTMPEALHVIGGGRSPHFTPGIHPAPRTHTTALVAKNALKQHTVADSGYDVMMSDAPICSSCHRIQAGLDWSWASGLESQRQTRLQAESWHRRRRRHKPVGHRHKDMKRCKKRRKTLAANIKKCRRGKNQKRCRTLRDRYKQLRQACKRDRQNQSIIPGDAGSLPDPRRLTPTDQAKAEHGTPGWKEQWEQWEKTKSETDVHGQCGKPVPQVIRVREILAGGDEVYYPSCVLRYRCRRDAGCCQHEYQVCSAMKSEKIEKTVLVAKTPSKDYMVHFENLTMKTFTVDNDTDCGCVDITTPVEKPCPHPFVFDIESRSCKCQDSSFKRSCRQILRGERKLLPSDVRCIKEDKCRALSICSYGEFDFTRYQCPRKPEVFESGRDVQGFSMENGKRRGKARP